MAKQTIATDLKNVDTKNCKMTNIKIVENIRKYNWHIRRVLWKIFSQPDFWKVKRLPNSNKKILS